MAHSFTVTDSYFFTLFGSFSAFPLNIFPLFHAYLLVRGPYAIFSSSFTHPCVFMVTSPSESCISYYQPFSFAYTYQVPFTFIHFKHSVCTATPSIALISTLALTSFHYNHSPFLDFTLFLNHFKEHSLSSLLPLCSQIHMHYQLPISPCLFLFSSSSIISSLQLIILHGNTCWTPYCALYLLSYSPVSQRGRGFSDEWTEETEQNRGISLAWATIQKHHDCFR